MLLLIFFLHLILFPILIFLLILLFYQNVTPV
jgi:hypothetical protein